MDLFGVENFQKEKHKLFDRIEDLSKAIIVKDFELLKVKKRLGQRLIESEQARKMLEKERSKIAEIITNFVDGLLMLDDSNRIYLINPRAEEFLNIKKDRVLKKTIGELVRPSPSLRRLGKFLQTRNFSFSREELIADEDFVLEASAILMKADKRNFSTLIILHDVTREKRIERVKSEFVSIAAHQLRTPLTGIKWSLNALLEEDLGKLGKDQKKLVSDGYDATLRLIELINDLLDTARIEEGRFGFRFINQSITPMVERVFKRYRSIAKEKGISLNLELPKDKLPSMNLDEEKIGIVIDNLIDNAIKYTIPGGTVRIQVVKDKQHVTIRVIDTGIGIPKSQYHRVFTKFFRAVNAQLAETSGTGLGLYVARNIVTEHKGTFSFESKENKGSTFSFSLPIFTKDNKVK